MSVTTDILKPNDKFGNTSSWELCLTCVRNRSAETPMSMNINALIITGPRKLNRVPVLKLNTKQKCTIQANPSVPATR